MERRIIGLLSSLLILGSAASAQEPEGAEAAQATDAVQEENVDANRIESSRLDEIDELEPGVPSATLVAERRPSTTSAALDELDLGRTEITGNQELPTVLYIVPWQKSDPGELTARPGNSLLDEVLAPVDRGEFVREVDYYSDLFEAKEER